MGCHRLLSPGAVARPCCARAAPSQEPGIAFPENRNNLAASLHECVWRVFYQLQEKFSLLRRILFNRVVVPGCCYFSLLQKCLGRAFFLLLHPWGSEGTVGSLLCDDSVRGPVRSREPWAAR